MTPGEHEAIAHRRQIAPRAFAPGLGPGVEKAEGEGAHRPPGRHRLGNPLLQRLVILFDLLGLGLGGKHPR